MMNDPIEVDRVRPRLWLAFGLVMVTVAVTALAWPAPARVRLMQVGFTEHEGRGRSPVFCLTNGSQKPVIYSDDTSPVGSFRYSVQMGSGWSKPYMNRDGFGMAPHRGVLAPGQSVNFQFGRPLGPRGWQIGIAYYPCEAAQPVTKTKSKPLQVAASSRFFAASNLFSMLQHFGTAPPPQFVRTPSLGDRLAEKFPPSAPVWMRRMLQSQHRDPVAWGPVME